MPVKLRLSRHGRKKRPYYHIVVADARAPRDGKFIDQIGHYNPTTVPADIDIDIEKAYDWIMKGAQPTHTVRAILRFKGVLYKKHLQRGVAKGAFTQEVADQKLEEWLSAKTDKVQARKDALAKDLASARTEQDNREKASREAKVAAAVAAATPPPAAEEAPAAEAPAAEEAAAEEPKAEAPAAEEPKAEAPAAEEVKAEEPAKEEPKAEEPAKEEPKAEEPAAEEKVEAAAPVVAAAPTADAKPDDLTKIEGIGPKISEVLAGAGFASFADLAAGDVEKIKEVLAENKLASHDPGTWPKQSKLAADGKWEELKTLQDELDGGKPA